MTPPCSPGPPSQLLALLDVAWLDDTDGWNAAVGEWLATQRAPWRRSPSCPAARISVVSSETGVPTTLRNPLPYP